MLFRHYPTTVIAAAFGMGVGFPFYFGLRSTLPIYLLENGGERNLISRQFGRHLVVFANECDVVISPSEHVMNKLAKFKCKRPIVHIPNSISIQKSPGKVHVPAEHDLSVKFICVGRVSREKRQYYAIEAFNKIAKMYNAELFIVGDGPDTDRCFNLVNDLGLQDRVHFLGNVTNTVAKDLLSDADVMVLPSYNFDNQPMVILESLVASVGILYCDPQLQDGLTSGNSLLVHHSVRGLAGGFKTLCEDKALRTKLAKGSTKLAKAYSTQSITKRVEKIYKEVLATHV
jgi:glycosyltransferase involved in cell wall biosynthesis